VCSDTYDVTRCSHSVMCRSRWRYTWETGLTDIQLTVLNDIFSTQCCRVCVENCCSVLHQLGDVQVILQMNLPVGNSVAVCFKIKRNTLCIYTYMCTIHINIRVYINVYISLQT